MYFSSVCFFWPSFSFCSELEWTRKPILWAEGPLQLLWWRNTYSQAYCMTCFINLQQKDKSRFIMPDFNWNVFIWLLLIGWSNLKFPSIILAPEFHHLSLSSPCCICFLKSCYVIVALISQKLSYAGLPASWCPHLYPENAPLYIFSVSSNSTFQSTGPIYSLHFVLAEISRNDYQYLDKTQSFKQCSKQDPKTEKEVPISLASSSQHADLASWTYGVNRIASI